MVQFGLDTVSGSIGYGLHYSSHTKADKMRHKALVWTFVSFLAFGLIYFLHHWLSILFGVSANSFVSRFYRLITLISAVMAINLLVVAIIKSNFIGYTFLIWSMLKVMLVMGFFIIFVLMPHLKLDNNVIFDIISLYFLYLFYEVTLSLALLKE